MAESEQSRQLQPGFNNDGDGHHQSPQRKRSNVEAFDEFGEPLQTSESSKMSSSREELELLEEFADIVQQRLDSCGQIYSSADEVYLLPGFMPQTDSAIKRCQDILQQAKNILHSASHQDNNTHDLGKAINDAMFKEDLPTRRIGFVGDSGAGKSSLINSLLDLPNLAHAEDNGEACTNVPIEYSKLFTSDESPFQAEAHFYAEEEIHKILKTAVDDWYSWFKMSQMSNEDAIGVAEAVSPEDVEAIDHDKREQLERQAKTSFTTFRNLFLCRPEFATDQKGHDFLVASAILGEGAVFSKMQHWTEDMMRGLGGSIVKKSARSAEEMKEQLEPFVTVASEGTSQPRPWPLIKIVRVGVRSPILERGVVFVDLPGTSDVNIARAKSSARNRRDCQFHFIVTAIKRAETENSVHEALNQSRSQLGSNVAVICTHNDEMDEKTLPRSLRASEADSLRFNRLKDLTKKLENYAKGLQKGKLKLDDREKLASREKMDRLQSYLSVLKRLKLETMIQMRNLKVSSSIQRSHQNQQQASGALRVYSVSNAHYLDFLEGYDVSNMPSSLDVVGIPAVRLCALTLPSQDRFKKVWEHWTIDVPEVITRIAAWCVRSTIARRLELRAMVEKQMMYPAGEIDNYFVELNKALATTVLHSMSQRLPDWKTSAIATAEEWSDLHYGTYNARLRRRGAVPVRRGEYPKPSWNAQLRRPVEKDLQRVWSALQDQCEELNRKSLATEREQLDSVREIVQGFPGVASVSVDALTELLQHKKRRLEGWWGRAKQKIHDAIKLLVSRCSTEDDQVSLIAEAMEPLYAECVKMKGPGRGARQKDAVMDAMIQGQVYENLMDGLRRSFEESMKIVQQSLMSKVERLNKEVLEDYDRVFTVEEYPVPGRDELRQKLLEFNKTAFLALDGPVRAELKLGLQHATDAQPQDVQPFLNHIDEVQLKSKQTAPPAKKDDKNESQEGDEDGTASEASRE